MITLDTKDFGDFLNGGIVETYFHGQYTFTNYDNPKYEDVGITYDLLYNEFKELNNIKLTKSQLNKIEDQIIEFYVEKKIDAELHSNTEWEDIQEDNFSRIINQY